MSHSGRHSSLPRLLLCLIVVLFLLCAGFVAGINHKVVSSSESRIMTAEDAATLSDVDCILVLGAGLRQDGSPSAMLRDRILTGCELWKMGTAPLILMSGDGQSADYDEVGAMLSYAEKISVPLTAMQGDRGGLSTYDSILRACHDYGYRRIVIVTQEYHLYRALYIAEKLGLDAYGVSADRNLYRGQAFRECREIVARVKDFFLSAGKNLSD